MRHRLYALCPYFAMFPEAFAEYWIKRLTKPHDVILDPFSGRGTTALTALLCGRNAISSDVNSVAICLTKAKTSPPTFAWLKTRLSKLRREFDADAWQKPARNAEEFFQHAYAPPTLRQLLYLRENLDWKNSRADNMLAALTLGSLHGEASSRRYLSNQMPRTISTKPRYSVNFWKKRRLIAPERDVFEVLAEMAAYRYESPLPSGNSLVLHTDMRNLPRLIDPAPEQPIRCAITSPPYLNVTSFEEDQWLRLWFLGSQGYPKKSSISRDDRHIIPDHYWSFIGDMWRSLGAVMDDGAHVVIRIGSMRIPPHQLRRALWGCAQLSGRKVNLISSKVSEIKKRQTDAFRPDAKGCAVEVDCHFRFAD
ncbi:MAG: DNA methyltransferase [Terriglobia bacterium]